MGTEVVDQVRIVKTPGVCGGTPRIDGHRIRVQDVAIEHEWQGLSPDEICREHPGLTLAQVHAALSYYYDHRAEILAEIEADRRAAEAARVAQQDLPGKP
jgi:uncharacterized protein (DUF433 family)